MSGKQTDWPYVINLGNSIIGVSVLAMPFCFTQCGIMLSMLLMLGSAWLTNITCNLLMKGAHTAKKRSYEFLALHTFGAFGKFGVEISIIGLLIGTCVAFHVIIGDLGPAIVSRMLAIENTSELRTIVMVSLGLLVALPLGLLKNIESLANISAISLGFYTVFIAEVFTAAFPNLWSGVWVTKVQLWNPQGVFKCIPIFSLAFACQSQLFIMYDALPEPSLKRMNTITKNAISLVTCVYLCVGYFGYVAFCDEEVSGDILMNFRPTIFSEAVKMGFVMSVAVSFPLVIFPCRTSLHTLMFAKTETDLQSSGSHENFGGSPMIPEPHFKLITIAIVTGTLLIGVYVPNIEFVLAITGSTMGSMICYIFPSVMYISLMSMSKTSSKSTAQVVLFLGVTILLASTYTTLYSQDQVQAGVDDSVVKIAVQDDEGQQDIANKMIMNHNEENNVPKEDEGGGGEKSAGIKDTDEEERDVSEDDDRRQEPPNPHAPVEDEVNKDKQVDQDKENTNKEAKDKSNVEEVEQAKKIEEAEKAKAAAEVESKKLLVELEKQREEQKELIQQQKEIIEELKLHQKIHEEQPDPAGQNQAAQAGQIPQQPEQAAQNQQPVQAGQNQQPVQAGQNQQPVQAGQNQQPVQAAQNQQPVQAGQNQQPVQAGQNQQPVQAGQNQEPVQAAQNQQPVQAAQNQQPVQAAQNQPPVIAAQNQPPVQAAQNQLPVQAAQNQQPIKAAQNQPPVQAGLNLLQAGQKQAPVQVARNQRHQPPVDDIRQHPVQADLVQQDLVQAKQPVQKQVVQAGQIQQDLQQASNPAAMPQHNIAHQYQANAQKEQKLNAGDTQRAGEKLKYVNEQREQHQPAGDKLEGRKVKKNPAPVG